MKIYLIRHALSIANSLKIWTGQMDVDLSAAGIAEQRALSKRFQYPSADIYVSSPLLRCTHSLKLLYGRDADILMPEFMECSLGILEGKSYTNLNDDDNYLAWLREPDQAPSRHAAPAVRSAASPRTPAPSHRSSRHPPGNPRLRAAGHLPQTSRQIRRAALRALVPAERNLAAAQVCHTRAH